MNTFRQSILEYDDVFHAVSWSREQALEIGIKKGLEIGMKKGIEIGIKKGVETGKKLIIEEIVRNSRKLDISIKQIAEVTGLTEEQISAIFTKFPVRGK
jgi:predicted transposase YdaD